MPFSPANEVRTAEATGQEFASIGSRILSVMLQPLKTARGGRLTTHADRYRIAAILSLFPLRLGWLLHIFGSDKQKTGEHLYGATYHALMQSYRYKRIRLLEIGVLGGASLLAWRAFFPRGTFIGCDIDHKVEFAIGRILTQVTDQSSSSDLRTLCDQEGPFDIIIDDGSHQNAHQIFTFYEIFDRLAESGLYIIEDVQTSFWPGYFGGAAVTDRAFLQTCVGEFLELSKYLNHSEFFSRDGLDDRRLTFAKKIKRIAFEHNLIIIQKGTNDEVSNFKNFAKANLNWRDPAEEPI
jgi:demethylmacrocin O-methyltransferase